MKPNIPLIVQKQALREVKRAILALTVRFALHFTRQLVKRRANQYKSKQK